MILEIFIFVEQIKKKEENFVINVGRRKMTKLTNMDIPTGRNRGGPGFYYCETCKEFVPWKDKHNKKHHKELQ